MKSLSPHSPSSIWSLFYVASLVFLPNYPNFPLSTFWSLFPPMLEKMESGKLWFFLFVLFFPPYSPPPSPPALDERLWGSWFPPCLLSRRMSWGNRRYWLSWWRCHQSQMGGWGSGRGQSKCQGSERKGPWASLGGNWEAPPEVFLLFL